ncbi:LysR substrate-binding domain-containing protein [Paracoccus sp. 1_MG-2023]|uniref:LysR family transcriptional regulator n=1 Tax=unclassified Paracoccus (in: a-proteobacteria) TaxID=2688777 RepID=UPI001C097281|nr:MULTISPECIES: LysR family transcriptional regulator [unclassified Paracoccus (in: a-proteobacteria)]MBU2958290.1 LysR family transcriptional regulator [Paracoccus sp. C2R09]MDO6668417.1 LysR substrate-binding domain-containing protein [Paracoccus sp. 1_MG-2023]
MDIDSLRLFVLAAERLNITAAGRDLRMAPAVASARLAKLEQQLGAELLHRTTRKVSLSHEGEAFLPYATEILAQIEAGRAVLGHDAAQPTGTLRFAAPSSFAQRHIMPLLPAFHQAHPGITLDLRLSDTRFDLIEGSFDLALRSAPLQDSSLKGRKLAEDPRILCASPGYVAEHGMPRRPDDLPGHHLLSWKDMAARDLTNGRDVWRLDPKAMKCRAIFDDGASMRIATTAGAGISINSVWNVAQELREGSLVQILPDWRLNDRSVLWLVYPRSNVLTPKTRLFMDFLIGTLDTDWMGSS